MRAEFLTSSYFQSLQEKLCSSLKPREHLLVSLTAESSQFIRINGAGGRGAKIRQIGSVQDAMLSLTLIHESAPAQLHKAELALSLGGISYLDQQEIQSALKTLQIEVREVPPNPFVELPINRGKSATEQRGKLLPLEAAPEVLISNLGSIDLAGIYASGTCIRAMADSAGTFHWFSTDNFSFDHSIFTPEQRAVKGHYAGQSWNSDQFASQIRSSRKKLDLLERPARKLQPGDYRVYLEPAAFHDLIFMLSWGGVSEASIRQGDSPLQKIRSGEKKLSPFFSLSEDFSAGNSPRFNTLGELAPDTLELFSRGELKNTLISSKTAKEYGLTSNQAEAGEALRSPRVGTGSLKQLDILQKLGTGLYLSNLHYLNWSNQPGGRITGMTRYACFWVENGEMVCPIENLRFDDSIFRFFGDSLEGLSETDEYHPSTSTYFARALGGARVPGALLSGMRFTL